MKKAVVYLFAFAFVTMSCSKSEDVDLNDPNRNDPVSEVPNDPERVDYELLSVDDSGIAGLASFIPRSIVTAECVHHRSKRRKDGNRK